MLGENPSGPFGQTIGGYLTTCLKLARFEEDQAVSDMWRICTALRLLIVLKETARAERAIGIYSSLFAEQVLGFWGNLSSSSWDLFLGGVEFHKLGQVELWFLEDLDFADKDVLKWEYFGALLLDLLSDLVSEPSFII